MNIDLIKEYIAKSEIYAYSINEKGIIEDKQLENYISKSVDEIFEISGDAISETIIQRGIYTNKRIDEDAEISKGIFFILFLQTIHNYLFEGKDNNSFYIKCSNSLSKHSLQLYQSIIDLMISGQEIATFSLTRMIYEAYVILKFITEYPEISEDYYDHSIYSEFKIMKISKEEYNKELEDKIALLENKYDKSFFSDFGWTQKIITKTRDRKLSTLAKVLNTDGYNVFYRLSSDAIHSSSFFVNLDTKGLIPSNSINMLVVEMISNGLMSIMKGINLKEKNAIYLRNIIYAFREELLGEPQGYCN